MKLRAKHRFHISIVSFLCVGTLAASLCSCEKKETQDYAFTGTNGDASSLGVISVQVREDGSGTRNQFEEYLGISMSEDNVDKYKDIKQCTVLTSGSAMASTINESKNGIGYVSYGQMQGDSKALAVDRIVCTRESIADHAYPLTRDFTLVWVESPNALRDDFVKYICGAGQKIVGETYVPVAKETSFLADPDAQGTLSIRGSSSMADLLTELADAYMAVNLFSQSNELGDVEFEIDKEKLWGRCNYKIPREVENSIPFSKKIGYTTDPIIALKKTVDIKPEETASLEEEIEYTKKLQRKQMKR